MANAKNKYKIVFDANNLHCDEEDKLNKIFNSNIKKIFNFLKSNKVAGVSLCMPQLVIDERISKRLRQIRKQHESFNVALRNLKTFGSIKIKEKNFKKEKYQKILNEDASKIIKKYKVKIIPTAKIEQRVVTDRALNKVAPFYGGEGDKGFKDTLIWLSLLKDAKKNKKYNYVLLTNDATGFGQKICEKEFKKYSSADFWVIKNLSDLKKFLDERLNLDLELKKLYRNIEQSVLAIEGTITSQVGNYINTRTGRYSEDLLSRSFSISTMEASDRESGNFDFYSLKINNISQVNENEFNIEADLKVIVKESDNERRSPWADRITAVSLYPRDDKKIVKYNISFKYNKNSDSLPDLIEVLSVKKDMSHIPYEDFI